MYRHGLGTQETERSSMSRIVDMINMKMFTDDDVTPRIQLSIFVTPTLAFSGDAI